MAQRRERPAADDHADPRRAQRSRPRHQGHVAGDADVDAGARHHEVLARRDRRHGRVAASAAAAAGGHRHDADQHDGPPHHGRRS
jgi:hypothetical protein